MEHVKEFGNFLRWKADDLGGITEMARLTTVAYSTLQKYMTYATPEVANVEVRNQMRLAKALGYESLEAFTHAWQTTELQRYPKRGMPSITLGRFLHARLPVSGVRDIDELHDRVGVPTSTITKAFAAEDEEGAGNDYVALQAIALGLAFASWADLIDAWKRNDVKAGLPYDIIVRNQEQLALRQAVKSRGFLTPEQLDAFAKATDLATFDLAYKQVREQIVGAAKERVATDLPPRRNPPFRRSLST